MKRFLFFASIFVLAVIFALIARPYSLGVRLEQAAGEYTHALSSGDASSAIKMIAPATAQGLSQEFLAQLQGTPVPECFRFDGTDSRGIRMVGSSGENGSRVVWFSIENGIQVTYDTALDNILGSAVVMCRENAMADPTGHCPVSGRAYLFDQETLVVVCPEGHLGDGIVISSDACSLKRDSVMSELCEFLEEGYEYPETLEDMFTLSGGEYGRRGGYRCPDNGYKYYELRNGAIYCPFHDESSEAAVTE